jgi:hypothetical protein
MEEESNTSKSEESLVFEETQDRLLPNSITPRVILKLERMTE